VGVAAGAFLARHYATRARPNAQSPTPHTHPPLTAQTQFNDAKKTWVNASVALTADGQGMVLAALPPAGASAVTGTSYGWGAVPFMTVYLADAGLDLPVQAWQSAL
jgi:hypothetical protein